MIDFPEIVRTLILGLAGFTWMTIAYLVIIDSTTRGDLRRRAGGLVELGTLGLVTAFIGGTYAHIHDNTITWRSVLAAVSFAVLLVGLARLARARSREW